MPAILDVEIQTVVEVGPAVVEQPGRLCQAAEDIDLREGIGGVLQGIEMREDVDAELAKSLVFEPFHAFIRTEDFVLHEFEFRSVIAFAGGGGLFADVIVGREGGVGLGDLDIISEDRVVFYLERFDAGAGDFAILEIGEPLFALRGGQAHFCKFGKEIIPENPALLERGGWFIDDGSLEVVHQFRKRAQAWQQALQQGGMLGICGGFVAGDQRLHVRLDLRHLLEGRT